MVMRLQMETHKCGWRRYVYGSIPITAVVLPGAPLRQLRLYGNQA